MTDHGWNGTERRPIKVETARPEFEAVGDAFELDPDTFAEPPETPPSTDEQRFYAVMAQPGHTVLAGSETPKLCVLYVTPDGATALKRFLFAEATDGLIRARDPIPPAIDRDADRGTHVSAVNRHQHREQVRRLHDVAGPNPRRREVPADG